MSVSIISRIKYISIIMNIDTKYGDTYVGIAMWLDTYEDA